jgi:phenylalanyl-tRNA synthetase beta chain
MDIKILDSWLREYLETTAKPVDLAKYLSLSGPSVERIEEKDGDFIYDIEVTTNRIDSASVYGIAREASAILPRFGVKAKLKNLRSESKDYIFTKKVSYLSATVDEKLCPRFTAVLIKNVVNGQSPEYIKKRLESSDIRPINNIVDISNYIMLELGQPVHTFDYDKIKGAKMILRESKKGEIIETLDDKKFTLNGGDIVIEDGKGRLIDLAGIMGGKLSAVDEHTKNVLLFIQTYNPINIRKTSMSLAQRTMAATIFEKGIDTELVAPAILQAIELFKTLTKGVVSKEILNIYPEPYKTLSAKISYDFIKNRLGIEVPKKDVVSYLSSLGFECNWSGNMLTAKIPSFRAKDVKLSEDLLEEIARIYGYHNLPSKIMEGDLPERPRDTKFSFEQNIRNILSGFGGMEIYTLSLVPQNYVDEKCLKLKNALGPDTEYLRTSMMPSIVAAANENIGLAEKFHLFEIANVYISKPADLPEEILMLAGIFLKYSYRQAKGIVEGLFEKINLKVTYKSEESKGFGASKCVFIYYKDIYIGKLGILENTDLVYYEFVVEKLLEFSPKVISFIPISKYPAQIEDINFILPETTRVGEVVDSIKNIKFINNVELVDTYQSSCSFRIWYQDTKKTLTNEDVEKIRKEIISSLKSKFGASIKD